MYCTDIYEGVFIKASGQHFTGNGLNRLIMRATTTTILWVVQWTNCVVTHSAVCCVY